MTGQPDSSWLQERLFERRIVLCRGVLDDALAGRVAAELMTLDALGDGAIELQFDSQATVARAGVDPHRRHRPARRSGQHRVLRSRRGCIRRGALRRREEDGPCPYPVPPERSGARDLRTGERAHRVVRSSLQTPRPVARAGGRLDRSPAVRSCRRLPRGTLARCHRVEFVTGSSTRSPETGRPSVRSGTHAITRFTPRGPRLALP